MPKSFPVDIGWSLYGEAHSIVIKPHEGWKLDRWDNAAHLIHGYAIPGLRRTGRDVRIVARTLNEALGSGIAYTDSVGRDTEWVDMVFSAAGATRTFRIESVGPLLASLGISADIAYAAFSEARESKPPQGPAIAGVHHLQEVFDILETKGHLVP